MPMIHKLKVIQSFLTLYWNCFSYSSYHPYLSDIKRRCTIKKRKRKWF